MLGFLVTLNIQTKRFWCKRKACSQRIFSASLSGLAVKHARATTRRDQVLATLGLFLGGRPAARASIPLHVAASRATTLRKLRKLPLEKAPVSAFVGIDDFAWKKGHRYGTIIVDLPTHRVVDLLPDREAKSVANWTKNHQHIRVVSRDRSGAYADGIKQGAPQALQVADRFHLHVNATEALQRIVESKHRLCTAIAKELANMIRDECDEQRSSKDEVISSQVPTKKVRIDHRRERRLARYEEVVELRRQGFGYRTIARTTQLSRATVRSWIRRDTFPEYAPMRKRGATFFEEWITRMKALHEKGMRTAIAIFRALRQEGYRGSYSTIKKYCRSIWKRAERTAQFNVLHISRSWRSPRAITWLLLHDDQYRDAADKRFITLLCERDEELQSAVSAAREFVALLRTNGHVQLFSWIERATSTLLASFAHTIRRDAACVAAAMSEPWSQGCVEGNVNRLKMIKRQMYGRGNFDLLRRRVLMQA